MRIKILLIIGVLLSSFVYGQNNASSPYSSIGLGETGFFGSSYFQSLGGASVSLIDSTQTNFFNPSSYASVATGLPIFSIGINNRTTNLEGQSSTGQLGYTNITHFSLVVPFAQRFGIAFGLKPFSRVGYEVNDSEVINNDSIFYNYSGNGGIQQLFTGFSANVIENEKHRLGIGINGNFMFGFTQNISSSYRRISASQKGAFIDNRLNYRGFTYDLGLNYSYSINRSHNFTFGATYTPEQSVGLEQNKETVFYNNYNNLSTYDTISSVDGLDGRANLPSSMKIGLTYTITPMDDSLKTRRLKPRYVFTAEYGSENWSTFSRKLGNQTLANNLQNASVYRFGFEYTPHRIALDRATVANYFTKIRYRLGVYTSTLPIQANGSQLTEFGTSFGIGLPIVFNRAISSINIGVSYGERGNGNINTIQENFWGLNFGVNLTPGYDRWFRKYKYD